MVVNEGLETVLDMLIADPERDILVHLFKNDVGTIDHSTIYGDLEECDFDGYAALDSTSFGTVAINGSDAAEADGPTLTWTATGGTTPNTVYGLAISILDLDFARRLLYATIFDTPISIAASGDAVVRQVNAFVSRDGEG